ncbi:MAG: isochorismatase family protein [Opitutaceae bacterium]
MSELAPPSGVLLLCLDLQPVFLKVVADSDQLLRRCGFAISAAAGLGLPVVFTEQAPQKLGGTAPALLALAADASVFPKKTFSALGDPEIRAALLEKRRVEHLLLCGLETPVCVYQSAADALAAGIEVTILSDCVGARRTEDAVVCLKSLRHAGAHVLPAETVFYAMLREVNHPFFRTFTQLVKLHG